MTPFVLALLGTVVGLVGGYVFGVAQSRSERRDNALAEIFKEMSLFYRSVVSWTADPTSNGPVTEPNTPWEDYCRRQYEVFLRAFYGNAIWLGTETYDLIQEFADAGKDILNEFRHMTPDGRLPNRGGVTAWDRRAERLAPKQHDVEDALRAEVETSRYIIPYRIVIKKNAPDAENRG